MIALHMIVAGYEDKTSVLRCLESVKGEVDRAYVLITTKTPDESLKEAIEATGAIVEYEPDKFLHEVTEKDVKFIESIGLKPLSSVGDKLFQFDKARNHAMSMVPKEHKWLLWLDADDILRGKGLREVINLAEANQVDSVFFNYIYQAEYAYSDTCPHCNQKVGSPEYHIKHKLIEHLRERLIRNNGVYKWVAPIHETLIESHPTRKIDNKQLDVLHLSDDQKKISAIGRNMKALELSIIQTEGKDPRPLYYLGKSYFDSYRLEKKKDHLLNCKMLFERYLFGENPSGWAEERSQCWEYLTEVYRELGEINNAIKCAHNAMIEYDKFPSIYVNLAMCYLYKQEWERALFWIRQSSIIDQPQTTLVVNPKDLMGRALETIFIASLNTSKLDEAWEAGKRLIALYPDNPQLMNNFNLANTMKEERDITKIMVTLIKYLQEKGEGYKLKPLAQAIPTSVENNPFMADFLQQVNPPRTWGTDEVTIYCGPGFTNWSPKLMDDPKGNFIGGSEEAVICLSRELAKQGMKVTVYADPGVDEGEHEGVTYLPYYKLNRRDAFNYFVSWRQPALADWNLQCKKLYIWCHDVQNPQDYSEERLKKIAKVIVLAPEHRENIPAIPDEKIMISANGVNL